MEAFITHTISMHSTNGVVHVEGVTLDPDKGHIYLEFDARQLLNDIPSLYSMCKQAIKQEEEYQNKKYADFKKELAEDFKAKRGRPTR